MVDRCVCTDSTFGSLLTAAREQNLGLDELAEQTGCGERCSLCRPFIRAALETGKTVFDAAEARAIWDEMQADASQP